MNASKSGNEGFDESRALRTDRFGDLRPLRKTLADCGYSKSGLQEKFKPLIDQRGRLDYALLRASLGGGAIDLLLRLFALGESVPAGEARRILTPETAENLEHAGLLVLEAGLVRSEAELTPLDEWLLLSDFGPEVSGRPPASDYVLGTGPAPLNLAGLTVRRSGEEMLDLCAGGGIQCLFAARHAGRIVATDVNPRALSFAAFNIAVNGIGNVELRRGSLYNPVREEAFDLIVSNPPYVVSPDRDMVFRSAGDSDSDSLTEQAVRGAAARLKPGGFAVILLNWPHESREDWADAPLRWALSDGISRWLMCFDTEEPAVYAARWLRDGTGAGRRSLLETMSSWLAYYRRRGIGMLSAGAIVLHRRGSGRTWTRKDRLARDIGKQGFCGGQVERICLSEDFLASLDGDGQLLDMRFGLDGDHALVQEMKLTAGKWTMESSTLVLRTGFGFAGNADVAMMNLLQRLSAGATLRMAIEATAAAIGADAGALTGPVLVAVRNLMKAGHLTAHGPGPARA